MPITLVNDTATIGTTEYFLASDSTTATYQTEDCILQVFIDLNALAAGDRYRVRFYEKVNAGTARIVEEWIFEGAQAKPHWAMPSFIVGDGWEVSVIKLAGTDRGIPWSLRKVT